MVQGNAERFREPGTASVDDALTEVLRQGAQELLRVAVEAEVGELLEHYAEERDSAGRQRLVRNGHLPERSIQTGIGDVPVRVPRVRDRGETEEPIRFESKLVPRYLRKSKSIEELLPLLYLRGISTGDFGEALSALLGPNAKGLSASTISRLKKDWLQEFESWSKRDLGRQQIVYLWADGIYCNVRFDDARLCLLVLIGADETGKKRLLAVQEGYRESEQSWREILMDLKHRGVAVSPKLAVADGALGFWKAITKVFGDTRTQRCWMHKTGNVLNSLPKSTQPKAKKALHEIWQAETRAKAYEAFDAFVETYEAKYPRAAECLTKDRDELLAFYDFPSQQWPHQRPIPSNRRSPPSVFALPRPGDVCRERPCSPWSSSSLRVPRNDGDDSEGSTISLKLSGESSSSTENIHQPSPPDAPVPNI